MELTTVKQLSAKIHKAESSIRSDLIRNPQSIPPRHPIPNSRRILFRDVDLWLEGFLTESNQEPPVSVGVRRRGRPTKMEQLKRQK